MYGSHGCLNKQQHIDKLNIRMADDCIDDFINDNEKFHTKEHHSRIHYERETHTIKIPYDINISLHWLHAYHIYSIEVVFIKKLIDFFIFHNIYDIDLSDISKINEKLNKIDLVYTFNINGEKFIEIFDKIKNINYNICIYYKGE